MNTKRKVYFSFALLIVMTLVAKAFGLYKIESMSIPGIGFSSMMINGGMMMLTIRGYQWARLTLAILMFLSGVIFLITILFATDDFWLSLILLMFFMIHSYIGNFLLRDPNVKVFVDEQRKKYG